MLSTLFFPETQPPQAAIQLLATFFYTIHLYRPTEKSMADPGLARLTEKGLVTNRVPVTLGSDIERFEHFIRDVRGYGAEFHKGFLSDLAARSKTDKDESATWSLISGIAGSRGRKPPVDEPAWHAVVLLELAEILAREEAELNYSILAVQKRQQELMQSLRGDDNDADDTLDFEEMPDIIPARPPVSINHLTRAWGQLFLRDQTTDRAPLLTTRLQDSFDLLCDTCAEANVGVEPLCTLKLPGIAHAEADLYEKERTVFLQGAKAEQQKIAEAMKEISEGSCSIAEGKGRLENPAKAWNRQASDHQTPATLTFYAMAIPPAVLFRKLLRAQKSQETAPGSSGNTILAFIKAKE